jgi:hemimethylated DNA binding protein
MNRNLTRTLFRQFLRWNRKPYVQKSPFVLEDSQFQFSKYLQNTPHAEVTSIVNSEQYQYFLYFIFRQAKPTPSSIDDAFAALKSLNVLSEQLKSNYKLHCDSLDKNSLQHRVFQVGEVVRHKTDSYRGIVCGWHILQDIQHVYVLIDSFDQMNQSSSETRSNTPMIMVESYNLDFENHPSLRYIHNEHVKLLFQGYDRHLRRYIPNNDLSFRYAADFDIFRQLDPQLLIEASSASAKEIEETKRHWNLMSASFRILNNISTIAKTLRQILERNGIQVPESSPQSISQTPKLSGRLSGAFTKAMLSTNNQATAPPRWIMQLSKEKLSLQTVANNVIKDVIDAVLSLEELSSIEELIQRKQSHRNQLISQRLRRGLSFHRGANDDESYDYRQPVQSRYDRILVPNQLIPMMMKSSVDHEQTNRSLASVSTSNSTTMSASTRIALTSQANLAVNQELETSSMSMSDVLEVVSKALTIYNQCIESVDIMLQLRFQGNGITHLEGLVPSISLLNTSLSTSAALPAASTTAESKPEPEVPIADRIDKLSAGKPKYCFGEVVRHVKFNYRGIVVGWDQRPLTDVSSWEAVIGLPSGSEQVFYKILADDNDIEESFGITHVARPYYYVAEENLERVSKSKSSSIVASAGVIESISHPMKAQYLQGYDETAEEFYYPSKLSFCFPSKRSNSGESVESKFLTDSYKQIDNVLLEIYALNKYANHYARLKNYESISEEAKSESAEYPQLIATNAFQIRDLMTLLKSSPSEDFSTMLETLLYHIGNSHRNVMERKLMRQGVAYLKRMMMREAIECFEAILKDYDMDFIEAHNKLAVAHHNVSENIFILIIYHQLSYC